MNLPPVAMLRIDWPKSALDGWSEIAIRTGKMSQAVGHNDAYLDVVRQLRGMASAADFSNLSSLLRRRIAARALTDLWMEDKVWQERFLKRKLVDLLVESQKPRLGRLSLLQLLGLYFQKFDLLEQIEAGLRDCLEQHLKDQLRLLPEQRLETADMDVFSMLKQEGYWLLGSNGPRRLAEKAIDDDEDLADVFHRMGLLGYDAGRFGDLCRARFYLDTLKGLRVGEWHEVLDRLLDPAIYKAPYEGDRTIGHEALGILIDKAGESPGDAWQNFILHIAGDPRVTNQAPSYRQWWIPLGEARVQRVRGWLSREDLKLFLGALEQYGKETRNAELQRMFPERKRFLEGLFGLRLIRSTRLMLGAKAEESVKRILGKDVRTNFAKLDPVMADKAVIYLDCGEFFIVEGSHSFKMWIYLALPSAALVDYDRKVFSHQNLISAIPKEYAKSHPGLPYDAITHNGSWQSKAINFLARNGIRIDLEALLSAHDYRDHIRRHGMPVVSAKQRSASAEAVKEPAVSAKPVTNFLSIGSVEELVNEKIIGLNPDCCKILSYLYLHPGSLAIAISDATDIKIYIVNSRLLNELVKFVESRRGEGWFLNDRTKTLIDRAVMDVDV